ncbi:MAG: DUF1540 domain-containing protein [Butyrivibrio sp.]
MTDLGCCVDFCKHNEDNKCCRSDIKVGGTHATEPENTFCSSYEERVSDSVSNACCKPNQKLQISCEAENCVYNENRNCTAEHIDVGRSVVQGKTECSTFRMKK